jgi:AcrR family transcriptional regulator
VSKAQATKARIVAQAATLFNQQGYAGMSMSALMLATGLQKGGLYNHFSSKDELALAAFDYAVEQIQQRFRGALKGKRDAGSRLIAILSVYDDLLADPVLSGGCPILNTAIESDDTHPALRQRAQQATDQWQHLLRRILAAGIQRGEIHPDLEIESAITILIATLEGAIMLTKLYGQPIYLQQALAHLKAYVQQQLTLQPVHCMTEKLSMTEKFTS